MYIKNIFWSVFLILTFVLLNVDLWQAKATPQIFRDPDEAWYGIVMKHVATDACQGVPISYNFQDRVNFHSCHFFLTIQSILPGDNIFLKVIFLKILSRFLVIGGLAIFSWFLLQDFILGALLGFALFLDDGIYVFKPGLITVQHLMTGSLDDFTRMNRLISPMQYQVPLILWTLLIAVWIFSKRKFSKKINLIGYFCTFLTSIFVVLTPFYAWVSHFLATFWILILGWKKTERRRWWIATLFYFCTVSVTFLLALSKVKIPFSEEVLVRSGFFNHQWTPLFLGDKGLILGMLVLAGLIYFISRQKTLAILIPFSAYLLVNINIFTGKEFQNFHFKDYLGPLWFFSVIFIICAKFRIYKNLVHSFLVILIILGSVQNILSQTRRPSFMAQEEQRVDSKEVIEFFKKSPGAHVYCGLFYQILPLLTDVKCSWHHLLMTYPLSNEELLQQSLAQWRLSGLTDRQVEDFISLDALPTRSLGVWSHGAKPDWISGVSETETYSVANLHQHIIPLWMKLYQSYSLEDAIQTIQSPEYLILLQDLAAQNEHLKAVQIFSNYGIYRFEK